MSFIMHTRTIDVVCTKCGAERGARCRPLGFCRERKIAAARLTRETNKVLRAQKASDQ